MIVDTHQHLGRSMFSRVETSEAELIGAMDANAVDAALVMPQPTREEIPPLHDRIAEAAGRHRGRLFGIASIDPWRPEREYAAEARRCVRELGFVALKLHPLGHNLPPTRQLREMSSSALRARLIGFAVLFLAVLAALVYTQFFLE